MRAKQIGLHRARGVRSVFSFAAAAALVPALGCGADLLSSSQTEMAGLMPVPESFLDRAYPRAQGLLTPVDSQGYPVLAGPAMDPTIDETRRFYDTLGRPNGAAGTDRARAPSAPASFEEWKTTFGFPARARGESVAAWRARAKAVVYYNQYELGLGRELGCTEFDDGVGADGKVQTGLACFVTNYGAAFSDQNNSLRLAVEGEHPKNTVCISYRPSLGSEYEVQFYVYGRDGLRQDWAQLDTMGPRPHPQVCTNCHGGSYDSDRHLVKRGRFLPLDPAVMIFAALPREATRGAQEENIRIMNALALRTPLTASQRELFTGIYQGRPHSPGQAATDWVPAAWADTPEHADLYRNAVKPACGTCHMAIDQDASNRPSLFHAALQSPQAFAASQVMPFVCTFQMPNAQATMNAFWRPREVIVGASVHGSLAEALLTSFSTGLQACANLPQMSDCRRFAQPDAVCGNDHSGTACDRTSGRCVPQLGPAASSSPTMPNGVCKLDGSRGCPSLSECRASTPTVAGYDGACFLCGALGQAPCASDAGPR
ncbi:MAG: hypothetical protein ABUS79_07175 [Pseudomonadota bacterium]